MDNNSKIEGNQIRIGDIAETIRMMYPDAVSVEIFVNETDVSVTPTYKDPEKCTPGSGATYKCLDGQWAHRRDEQQPPER